MAIILTQTDNTSLSGFNVGCSGGSTGATTADREATQGGTAGSTEATVAPNTAATDACLIFQSASGEPNLTNWDAGDWVVRLDVTTTNSNVDVDSIYICERTSGGTYNTVTSSTGIARTLGTAQVESFTINRATDYSAAATSTIYIVVLLDHTAAHGNSNVGITPSQNIDTPIVPPSPDVGEFLRRYEHRPAPNPLLRM